MSQQLDTVDAVVAAFGGAEAMALEFQYTVPQVRMWKSRGRFSNAVKPQILIAAQKRGMNIAPHLIGLAEAAE